MVVLPLFVLLVPLFSMLLTALYTSFVRSLGAHLSSTAERANE